MKNSNSAPKEVSIEMLSATYDSLEVKDMSKESFINQCTEVMRSKKARKNSSLILPDSMN